MARALPEPTRSAIEHETQLMKNRIALAGALAAGLLAAASIAPEDRVEFRPAEGKVLTKTFVTEVELALEDLVVRMDGEEIDPELMSDVNLDEASVTARFELTVSDEYVSVGDGRPTELVRTYETLSAGYELGTGDSDEDVVDEIAGKAVRFRWNAEAGAYDRVPEGEDEIEDEELAMLGEDLDLRALLPGRAVSEGDTWRVSWKDLSSLVLPGLDLAKAIERGVEESEGQISSDVLTKLNDLFAEATVLCTYVGRRDGGDVGIIEIRADFEGEHDLSSAILDAAQGELPEGELDLTFLVDVAMELTGELAWDLAAGHMRSMSFDTDLALEVVSDVYVDMNGAGMDMGAEAEIAGVLRRRVTLSE